MSPSDPAGDRDADFCHLLRFHRQRAHLTQQHLAQLAGLGTRTINDLERGRVRRPHADSVRLLADALRLRGEAREAFERAAARPEPIRPMPHHLPLDVPDFTGRARQVAAIQARLARLGNVALSGIAGKAGVGKTALAVHVGHQAAGDFPDGQLFVNLGGLGGRRIPASEALVRILRALEVDRAHIPADLDGRVALYRSLVARRRLLIILDDASDEDQVRPLLPSGPGSAALITSRRPLAGLEGTRWLSLHELDEDESVELLARVAGAERVRTEPAAARRIVELSGRLPLAIRIAGAKLVTKPHWPLWELADRLTSEQRRLDELQAGDLAVRTGFSLSYRALDAPSQRVFRALGQLHTTDFPAWVPATLVGRAIGEVEEVLERLVDWQLLNVAGRDPTGRRRYRMHDLLAIFARECPPDHEAADPRPDGLGRAVGHWLTIFDLAEARLTRGQRLPPGEPRGLAGGWFATEFPLGWLTAQRRDPHSTRAGEPTAPIWELGMGLACALVAIVFELWSHWDDWRRTREVALVSGQRIGDRLRPGTEPGEPAVVRGSREGPWDEAVADLERCSSIFKALREWHLHAANLVALGNLYRAAARLEDASSTLERCLDLCRELGRRDWEAVSLFSLGSIDVLQGRLAGALERYQACMAIFCETGDVPYQAYTLRAVGYAYQQHGRFDEAALALERCVPVFRQRGDRLWEAHALLTLGYTERGRGRPGEAAAHMDACVPMFQELGDRRSEAMALRGRAAAELDGGAAACSLASLRSSEALFRELDDPIGVAIVLHDLGRLHLRAGRAGDAAAVFRSCLPIFRDIGLRLWEAATLRELSRIAG